jgi:hypothetical protein
MACGAETNPLAELCITCGSRLPVSTKATIPQAAVSAPIEPKTTVSTAAESKATAAPVSGNISSKSRLATTILALLLGIYGAHQFYVGRVGAGMAMLILGILGTFFFLDNVANSILRFFTGLLGPVNLPFPFRYFFIVFFIAIAIWAFVDFLSAVLGRFRDADDKLIQDWGA